MSKNQFLVTNLHLTNESGDVEKFEQAVKACMDQYVKPALTSWGIELIGSALSEYDIPLPDRSNVARTVPTRNTTKAKVASKPVKATKAVPTVKGRPSVLGLTSEQKVERLKITEQLKSEGLPPWGAEYQARMTAAGIPTKKSVKA